MKHDLPPGFTLISGKRSPTEGEYHIMLRCGFVDERIAYTPGQLIWKHGNHSGDIIAVRRVG